MTTQKASSLFWESASCLPKEARAKLPRVLLLLTTDPRHPSLQVKKLEGAARADVYECRLNQFWRIILRHVEAMTYDLVYVGPHDEAIRRGLGVREPSAPYGVEPDLLVVLQSFLDGNDEHVVFREIAPADLAYLGGERHSPEHGA